MTGIATRDEKADALQRLAHPLETILKPPSENVVHIKRQRSAWTSGRDDAGLEN